MVCFQIALVICLLGSHSWYSLAEDNDRREEGRICSLSMMEAGECPYDMASPSARQDAVDNKDDKPIPKLNIATKRGNGTLPYVPVNMSQFVSVTQTTHNGTTKKEKDTTSIRMDDIYRTQEPQHGSDSTSSTMKALDSPWGVDQVISDDPIHADKIRALLDQTNEYMKHTVFKQKEYRHVRRQCKNRDSKCSQWAVLGECQTNQHFMEVHCAPACQTCEMLDIATRCAWDPNTTPNVWTEAGQLNSMFERITTDSFFEEQYGPVEILSRPFTRTHRKLTGGSMRSWASPSSNYAPPDKILPDGPWVVSLEHLLTPEECDRLIELGQEAGYEPSYEVGNAKFDGTRGMVKSSGRTSYNAWCRDECIRDPLVQSVMNKLVNLTSIPKTHMEHIQLLRYEPGQQYGNHFDFSQHEQERPQGVRLLTVFLYLNDVDTGGETQFTGLAHSVSVTPKRGKVVIYPNVLDQDPNALDRRTKHRALPVQEGGGVKFGANVWFHQRDFQTPHSTGCTA